MRVIAGIEDVAHTITLSSNAVVNNKHLLTSSDTAGANITLAVTVESGIEGSAQHAHDAQPSAYEYYATEAEAESAAMSRVKHFLDRHNLYGQLDTVLTPR